MSKTVKIIVISAVAVVVTLAIVLGCVFGIKCTVTFHSDVSSDLDAHYDTTPSTGGGIRLSLRPTQTKVTRGSTFSPFIPTHKSSSGSITSINGVPVDSGDNYTFAGWYKDSALTVPWLSTDRVTSNITLYAKWQAD